VAGRLDVGFVSFFAPFWWLWLADVGGGHRLVRSAIVSVACRLGSDELISAASVAAAAAAAATVATCADDEEEEEFEGSLLTSPSPVPAIDLVVV